MNDDKFKFQQIMRNGTKVILLSGAIDEDTTFENLQNLGTNLIFNFKGVTEINSCGVRSWVNFVKEQSGNEITYEECPPVIVRQLNMVPSFLGPAKVSSVYIPYVCDACDTEMTKLVNEADFKTVEEVIPCENCKKGEMEFDGHPQQYFAFTKG